MYIFLTTSTATEIATTAVETIETINNSNGLKLDLTVTISVIIALCSIFSNLITTWLNNRHLAKMKKIELEQHHYENTELYKRNIFENYLKATGKYLLDYHNRTNENLYGEYYYLALMYVPQDIATEMKTVHSSIYNGHIEHASQLFEELSPKMHTLLKNM